MRNPSRTLLTLFGLAALSLGPARAGPAEAGQKLLCAVRAPVPPRLDGVLDEACWQRAEALDDFLCLIPPSSGRTTIRCAYDEQHLYVATECFVSQPDALTAGVAAIKAGPLYNPGWRQNWDGFQNRWSLELFLDPGPSLRNHYQLLYNAAGQIRGGYLNDFTHPFDPAPAFGLTVSPGCWRAEMVFPLQTAQPGALRPGMEWGLNFARNDDLAVALWRPITGAWNDPKQFGRLLIGDYAQWWEGAWTHGARADLRRLGSLVARYAPQDPAVEPLYLLARREADRLDQLAAAHPPTDRTNLERLYLGYADYRRFADRLSALCCTLEALP